MLSPNQESFITNYSKPSFTFAHLHQSSMSITAVVVHSVTQSQSGAFPIGSGLIFIADNVSFFEMTEQFHKMNLAAYRAWQQNRILESEALKPWEPVGCFEFLDGKEVTRAEMDVIRSGKYVHLLPTGFRTQPVDYSGHFNSGILDIQYFGVEGASDQEGQQDIQNTINTIFATDHRDRIASCSSEQLQEILDNFEVSVRVSNGEIIKLKRSDMRIKSRLFENTDLIEGQKKSNISRIELDIRSKLFIQNFIQEITVTDRQTIKNQMGQNIIGIEIETKGTVASSMIVQQALKSQSNESLCQKILKTYQNWSEDRVFVLLGLIDEEDHLDDKLFGSIDWKQLISEFVYGFKKIQSHKARNYQNEEEDNLSILEKKPTKEVTNIQSINQKCHNQLNEQCEMMSLKQRDETNKPILTLINAANVKYSTSIKTIFTLLLGYLIKHSSSRDNNDSEQGHNKPLESLDYSSFHRLFILLKYSRNIMDKELFWHCLQILNSSLQAYQTAWNRYYSFLRCDHFITAFPFEKQLFLPILQAQDTKDKDIQKSNSSGICTISGKIVESIPCRILSDGEGMINRTYTIDLMKMVDVQKIELQFEKATKQCAARMKIQIYKATSDSSCENGYIKHLVFSQDYTTATVYQLSVLAHQKEALSKYFKTETQGVDKLGIDLKSFKTRYLFIQCTFSLLPYIATSTDIQQATRIHILPNIKGHQQNTNNNSNKTSDANNEQDRYVASNNSIAHFEELFELKVKDEIKISKIQQSPYSFGYVKYFLSNTGSYILDSSGYYEEKVLSKGESNKAAKISKKSENSFTHTNMKSTQISDSNKDIQERDNHLDFEGQLQFVSNNFLDMKSLNSTQQQTNKEKRKPKNKVIQPSLSRRAPQQPTPNHLTSGEIGGEDKIVSLKDQLIHQLVYSSPSMLNPMEEQARKSPLVSQKRSEGTTGTILLQGSLKNSQNFLVSQSQSSIFHPVEAEDEDNLEEYGLGEIASDQEIDEDQLLLQQQQLSMEDPYEDEGYQVDEDMVSDFTEEQFVQDQDEDYEEVGKSQELEYAQQQLKIFLEDYHLLKEQGQQQSNQSNIPDHYQCPFDTAAQMDELNRSVKQQCDIIYKLQLDIAKQTNANNNSSFLPSQNQNNLSYLSQVILSLCEFLRIDTLSVYSSQSVNNLSPQDQSQQQFLNDLILGLFETFVLNEAADIVLQVRQLLQDVLIPTALSAGVKAYSLAEQILRRHMLDQHLSQRTSPARVLSQINYLNLLTIDQGICLLASIVGPLFAKEHQNSPANDEKEGVSTWTLIVSLCVLIKNEYIKLAARNNLKTQLLTQVSIDNSETLRVVSLIFFYILASKTITTRVLEVSSVMQPLIELLIEVLPRVSMSELFEFQSKLFQQETQQNLLYLLSICVCLNDNQRPSQNKENNNQQNGTPNIWESLSQFLDFALLPQQIEGLKQPSNTNNRSSSNAYILIEQDINNQYKNQLAFIYLLQLQSVHVIHHYIQHSSNEKQSRDQTNTKHPKQNSTDNRLANLTNPYSQVWRMYIRNNNQVNLKPNKELKEYEYVSLGHLDLFIALLASSTKSITSFTQRQMQASPSKKLLELQIRRRKSSESSRKGSWASRKGSEDILQSLCRKKSNTFQEVSLPFKSDYSLLLTQSDYIESIQYEDSPLIMIQFVIDIVEQLLLNQSKDSKNGRGSYYPEDNIDEDEEHKDFVNEEQPQNIHQINQFDYIQEKSDSQINNSAELEHRWILAMAVISLLPGKAIQESNIFTRLATQYLESPMDIQERQLSTLISLTKNILHTCLRLKEFCEDLISLVFSIINSDQFSWEGHQLRLVVSWLEMLLSKQFPPEESFYFPKESHSINNKSDSYSLFENLLSQKPSTQQLGTSCMCQLSVQGVAILLRQTSSFLLTHVNIGGVYGSEMGDHQLQNKLIISELLLRIIMSAESSHHRLAFIQAIHSQNSQHLIETFTESLSQLINFAILNCGHSQEDKNGRNQGISPCSLLSQSVEDAVMTILRLSVESSPLIIGKLVNVLFRFSDDLHKELHRAIAGDTSPSKKKANNLTMSVAVSLAERESRVFTKLLECWIQDDIIAQVLLSHEIFIQLLSIARILQSPMNNTMNTNFKEKTNSLSYNNSNPLQALTWILQGQNQQQYGNSSSGLPWNSLQNIQSPDCSVNPTSNNGSGILQPISISCDLKQTQSNLPSLNNNNNNKQINQFDTFCLIVSLFSVQSISGVQLQSSQDSLKKSMLPPLPSQQLFSQLSWTKNPSQQMMSEQGIFGNSEISENPKSSFLKYQIAHPSYLNSNSNSNAPPPIQNHSLQSFFSSQHANLQTQQSNQNTQQQLPQLPQLSPLQQVAQVLGPLISQGPLAKMDILSDLVSKYTNQKGSILSNQKSQQQPDNQPSPNPFTAYQGIGVSPLGIAENSSLCMSKIHSKNTLDPLIFGPTKSYQATIPQSNFNSNDPANLRPFQEVECANQVSLIPLPGMPVINQQPQDWSFNKKGGKSKLLQYFMTGQYHQELPLLFKLNKIIEIKKIRIGFNTISIDNSESILGVPSGVLVEGGTTKDNLLPLGMLVPLNEERYSQFGVRVFSKNYWRISNTTGSIKDSIESLCYPRVSFIQLRIMRPCVSVMEDISTLSSKSLSKIGISVNFLSILGFVVTPSVVEGNNKVNSQLNVATLSSFAYQQDNNMKQMLFRTRQQGVLKVLGRLCNGDFPKTIRQLSQSQKIVESLKSGFSTINEELLSSEESFSELLLKFSDENSAFGDWLFEEVLLNSSQSSRHKNNTQLQAFGSNNSSFSNSQSKLLLKIMKNQASGSSKVDSQHLKTVKLLTFIEQQMSMVAKINPDSHSSSWFTKISCIFPAIEALLIGMQIVPSSSIATTLTYLPISSSFVNNLIKILNQSKTLINGVKTPSWFNLLTRLLSNLLYLPSQFRSTEKSLRYFSLNKIWNHIKQSPASHSLAMVLVVFCKGSRDARQFFCQRIPELAELLVSDLRTLGNSKPNSLIQQTSKQEEENGFKQNALDFSQHHLRARGITRILAALGKDLASLSRTIQSQPLPLALFSLLKRSKTDAENTTLLRDFVDKELLSAFLELFIESFNSNSGAAILSEVIVADIKRLGEKRDRLFVEELLTPLLSAQKTIPVCFHVFEESTLKTILNPLEVLHNHTLKGRLRANTLDSLQTDWSDQFNTQMFSKQQKNSFTRILKQFSSETGLFKKLKDYSWTKQAVQTHDGEDSLTATLEKSVLNNPPYIVLIEGKNNGIKCVCGVFCTQPLAAGAHEFGYSTHKIANNEDCFMFYYSEDYQLHFKIEGNQLGSLEVAENHSFLSFKYREMDRITISLSATSTSFVDINLFDMKPLESGANIPHDIPNEFTFGRAEYWVLKPLGTSSQETFKVPFAIDSKALNSPSQYESIFGVSSLSSNMLFPSNYYQSESAYNFYRVPPVYHFPSGMTLKEVILQMNVHGMQIPRNVLEKLNLKINLKDEKNLINDLQDKTLLQIEQAGGIYANGIIDISISIDELFRISNKPEGFDQNHSFIQQATNLNSIPAIKDIPQINNPTQKTEITVTRNNQSSATNQILKCFIAQKGVEIILQSITESLASWEDQKLSNMWLAFIKETKLYGGMPRFFSEMMKNELLKQTLLFLLGQGTNSSSIRSKDTINQQQQQQQLTPGETEEEQQRKAFKEVYGIVAKVLQQGSPSDNLIKQIAVKLNILQQLFERISQISKEEPREYVEDVNVQIKTDNETRNNNNNNKVSKSLQSKEIETEKVTGPITTAANDQTTSSLPKKKKGIGYGTDQTGWNSKWNTNEYVDSKRNRNELLLSVIQAVCSFLEGNWKVPKSLQRSVCCSTLIVLLENAFRSGSLLEMSNQNELILEYLHLVELMAGQDSLLVALLPLGEHYKPKQISSIYELLQSLSKTADIFVHCLQSEQQESSEEGLGGISTPKQQAGKIADKILVVMECLERSMDRDKKANKTGDSSQKDKLLKETESSSQSPQSLEIQKVLSLPLSQKYKILLSNLRFGYVSMQDPVTSEYSHHYKNAIYQSSSVAHNKLVRLAQEVADMSNALPVEDTNSVFARCDTKRVDVMKCLIMGTAGTPYAHGAFLYDVYFEDNYPNSSPKVNLSTTGPGQVRFNPNLYQCGKVCLSLLGTWKGQASENWDPNISTLLQVLLSLQSIIMTEDVYFNEPGFEGQSGTEEGEKKNEGYSNIIRYCNIKIAMIKQIKNPPTGFEEIIQRHFYLKKEAILAECEEWLQRSYQKNAAYSGLVNDHNPTWCGLFKQPGKYSTMLAEAIDELREVLQSIPPPSRIDAISQQMGNKRKLIRGHIKPSLQAQTGAVETKVSPSEAINEAQQQHPKPISQQTVKEETAEQEEEEEEKYEFDIRSNISDQKQSVQQMDIHSEEVKNRWSRYICALGIESVRKQSSCSVFLSGCTNLGLEIAKNLTLAGLARLTILFDPTTTKTRRNNSLLGENTDPIQELQQLNPYVKVDCLNLPLAPFSSEHFQDILKLRDYQIVILTDIISHEIAYAISEFCHANRIFFIHTNVIGPFARVFIDFNEKFIVNDSNGEPFKDSFISSIEIAENKNINKKSQTVVTTLQPHGLQDGDTVTFTQVKGMERIFVSNNSNNQPESSSSSSLSINDTFHIVLKVQSPCTFVLASLLDEFSPYLGSGIVKGVKIPQTISFSSLAHSQDMSTKFFDANLLYHDFDKSSHSIYLHIAFYGLSLFQQKNQRFPGAWDKTDMREFSELCQVLYQKFEFTNNNQMEKPNQQEFLNFIALFSYTCSGSFHPLCAFIGGVVAQEAIKAMTNKFMPIKQFFYSDCIEVVPWNNQPILTQGQPQVALQSAEQSLEQYADIAYSELQSENTKNTEKHNFYSNSLVDPSVLLQIVIGKDLKDKLKHLNLFMIGSGAIGCELLKNFAMLSLCTGESTSKLKRGLLTLTDPDHIETSNLNRQFLFRQEHISKPKSITAAAAAIKINSHLKNHIVAKLDKVCEASKDIFNDGFFQAQDIVANALDNVQARKYVDKRCLTAKVPLLESGTLGPKGHVQVIVPYQSESYGSQEDPAEEGGDIPHCTLKMFPEETLHCVEWARDKFSKQATLKPKQLRIAMQAANQKDKDDSDYECPLSISELQKALKKLERKPRDFQDCIVFAVRKFYKYFRNTIRQLMHTYPLNTRLKDGTEFWKLPKRAPIEISMLDPNNQTHRDFIASVATICAKVFSIKYPSDFRKEERKIEIIQIAEKIQIDKFQPSEGKSQEIHSEVQSEQKQKINGDLNGKVKEQQIKGNDQINSADDASDLDFDLIQSSTKNLLQKIKSLMVSNNLTIDSISPEEFEKDNDQNGHIDFISSLANCRAINYSLTPMDWLDVKLKAGKIVPALATTTAAIAALQTIELVKQVMGLPISLRKNAFLNLAVPAFQLTEPAPPPIFKITSNISVSIWDNWEVTFEDSQNNTIQQLFDYFAINKKLQIVTILLDSELLFAQSMSEAEKISIKAASLTEAFFLPEEDPSYIELDILFTELDSTQILINTPTVRIVFKKQQSVSKEDAEAKYKLK